MTSGEKLWFKFKINLQPHTDNSKAVNTVDQNTSIVLGKVLEKIAVATEHHRTPLVVFDLDDTLIDCRHRKHEVFQSFTKEPDIQAHFPDEARRLAHLPVEEIVYRVPHNLDKAGITSPDFRRRADEYWTRHYFTHAYVARDVSFPGAVDFVRAVHQGGANLIYLSGRDIPGMGKGTRQSLTHLGFPLDDQTELILKPNPLMPDLTFKQLAIPLIRRRGDVIAIFENESRNLNALGEEFPQSLLVLMDTLHSPDPPPSRAGTIVLKKF